VAVISGMAGVGKTALALYWGQRVRERFPDGQLYVNLRGHAPPSPMPAIEALASFLQALGVPAEQVPVDLEQAAALYRSLLADKQMLVLLDDAHNLKQARPLLPGGRGCVVLVTSRDRLGGLVAIEGAAHLDLDVLDPDEARELLARVLGPEPIQAEPQAAAELARLCGYLPLALRVAAANLSLRPQLRITDHVTQLAAGDRLGELAVDQDETAAVRVAFDHSYAALPADARRLFRLLGLAPGPHLTADATAALAGTAPEPAGRLLERLARAHLIYQTATDRYTLHDLIRLYAVDRAHQEDTVADRGSAAGRLFAWYLATIDAAARLLYPESLRLPGPEPAWEPRRFDDHPAALAWLEAERPNLLAAVQHTAEHGPYAVAYLLANALTGFYMLRMYTVEWLAIANAGLAAAQADQHPLAEAVMELSLGGVSMRLARPERAAEHYTRALSLGEQTGWMELQGWTLNGLGMVNRRLQRLPEAVDCFSRAEEVNRRFGWLAGQAASVANLGIVYGELGRLRQAADCLGEALVLFRQLGSRGKEAHVLGALGEVCHQLGRLDDAADHLTRAQELVGDVGDRSLLTMIERLLAEVHRDAGRLPQALQLAQRTLALVREIEELSLESGMLTTVGSIYHQLGRYPQALVHHQQARRLAQQTDGRPHEVMALVGIADAQHRLGRLAEASDAAREAVALARAGAYRVEEGNALTTLAAIEVTAGRLAEGVTHAEQALVIHRETGHRLGEARALRELGNGQQRRGDTDAAAVSRRRAVTLFVEIGSPEAEQVRALAGAG
jgi:tetratricopeptide (TPR) repeat protein